MAWGPFIVILYPLPFVIGDALARSERVEEVIRTHIRALNEELHQRLQQQRAIPCEGGGAGDSREESGEEDGEEDHEADAKILLGSAGQ